MANRIAVSFEDEVVKVVYASLSHGSLTVRKTLLLKNEEFDDFLAGERHREFIVVADFKVSYYDILFLPPAKDKYLRQIVYSEIRKKNPELKDFSFSYSVLGETVRESRKALEVFFYAVSNADLYQIIQRFDKYRKTVKSIFPIAAALSRLVNALPVAGDEPQLCIAETGPNKTLFLVKGGKLHFIRTANALETGVHDIDVHDINMTVNYCRQTLRMTPSSVLLLGGVCLGYDAAMGFNVPSASMLLPFGIPGACVYIPEKIFARREEAMDFVSPIAALMPYKSADAFNILPRQYEFLTLQKKGLALCTVCFILLSLIALWFLRTKISEISRLKGEAALLRTDISMMESGRRSYDMHYAELMKYMPLINFLNSVNSAPDAQKALISLSSLKEPHNKAVELKALTVTVDSGALKLVLQGNIEAEKYADIQKHYRTLVDELRRLKGMTVGSDTLDIKNRKFQIEARYSDK
ncbi:MAG: hypothetical protein HQL09_02140 [Nitrospirae bacterium]|nr:hypothetical protein [Nitrospirota bacterium]